jgi:hypothetical protein
MTLEGKDSGLESCNGSGSINMIINGGVEPYNLNVVSDNGYNVNGTYGNLILNNLFLGNYTINVIDSVNTNLTQVIKINGVAPMKFIGDIKSTTVGGKPPKKVEYISMYDLVSGGTPVGVDIYGKTRYNLYNFTPKPYTIIGSVYKGWDKKDFPSSGLTITATDKNNCSISKTFK